MFPNPQDALPLPARPDLEQYKKRAKELAKAKDSAALHSWAELWVDALLRLHPGLLTPHLPVNRERWIDQVTEFAVGQQPLSLSAAQFVIARAHGFENWPKLSRHIAELERRNTAVSSFEQAADAIVSGDIATLEQLLRKHPDLIRAHSTRQHGATLLHYVAANGVEGYRQKIAKNSVEITRFLLKAGAEVNAVADVYGGSTVLGLVATSVHPERAGVQEPLMNLLLGHGASFDDAVAPGYTGGLLVNACLANGRGRAAAYLAARGARLDLEGAAGVGRLDSLKTFLDATGALNGQARAQMERGFLWACEYGRNDVVEFLLEKGVSLETTANTGLTGLHWAVVGGQQDTIKLLLARGASLETRNTYGGTALGQALWSAVNDDSGVDHVKTIDLLLQAGARIESGTLAWLEQNKTIPDPQKSRISELLRKHGAEAQRN